MNPDESWGDTGIVKEDASVDWVLIGLYRSDDNMGVYVFEPVFAGFDNVEIARLSSSIARFELVLANGTDRVVLSGLDSVNRGSGILSGNRMSAVVVSNRGGSIKDRLELPGYLGSSAVNSRR